MVQFDILTKIITYGTNDTDRINMKKTQQDKITKIIFIIIFILILICFYISQKSRLDNYSKWYCREIYGMTDDCQEKLAK